MLGSLLSPLLAPIGIDVKLTVALMFGFIAKEIVIGAFAVIYGMEGDALATHMATQMDWMQAVSFMLFTLIYTPCVSTIAAIKSESKSAAFTLLSVAWPLALAWGVSFVFYQSARALLGHEGGPRWGRKDLPADSSLASRPTEGNKTFSASRAASDHLRFDPRATNRKSATSHCPNE